MTKSINKAAKIARKQNSNNENSKQKSKKNRNSLWFYLSPSEIDYAINVIQIMKNVRYNGVPLAMKGNMTLSGVAKKGFLMILDIYSKKILANDSVIRNFQNIDNEILRDFIAFRAKYLNMNVDEQFENLERMGIITTKTKSVTK